MPLRGRRTTKKSARPGRQVHRRAYTIVVERETDPAFVGYYNVRVPALPGCLTYGKSLKEAVANAREAVEGYLATLKDEGKPLPEDRVYDTRTMSLEVTI